MSQLRKLVEEFGEYADTAIDPGALGAQVPQRVRNLPALLRHLPRDRAAWPRSATRSASSPRSRSASRGRSSRCARSTRAAWRARTSPTASRASSRSSRPATRRARRRSPTSPARSTSTTPSGRSRSRSRRPSSTRTASCRARRSTRFPRRTRLRVTKGQLVELGDALNEGSLNPAELLLLRDCDHDRAVPRRRGAEGLQVAGRRDPRQAHRAHRPADAEEGARRDERRHRAPAGPARRPRRARARERPRQEGEGRAGDLRADHPRHHEGVARDRVVPLGRLVPGDDEGAHGRGDRGQDRPAERPQGERDHRQAHPGRDRSQAVPEHHDRADRSAARHVPAPRGRGGAARRARGDRRGRRLRPRLARAAGSRSRSSTAAAAELEQAPEEE